MLNITIQEQDGNLVAILEGSLDTSVAPEAEKALIPLSESEGKDIILDCTGLTYISSAGLRLFLSILKTAEEKGQHVYVANVSEAVRNVFNITGFCNIFEFK